MSEFKDAIGWRGPDRLSFIVYGLWRADGAAEAIERTSNSLRNVIPGSEVSVFVATDEGWPCSVGVFDIECARWPDALNGAISRLLSFVCRGGAEQAWMMFEGMFNSVEDIFCAEWAAHIYAVQGDCAADQADLAIDDEVRHSLAWAKLVGAHRERVLSHFPSLRGVS